MRVKDGVLYVDVGGVARRGTEMQTLRPKRQRKRKRIGNGGYCSASECVDELGV